MRIHTLLPMLAIALFPAASLNAAILFSDNFNAEPGAPQLTLTDLANWSVPTGNVDVVGTGPGGSSFDIYPGNGYYVDLGGTGGANGGPNGSITTDMVFGPGTYVLHFLMGNNTDNNSLRITLGDFTTTIPNAVGLPLLVPTQVMITTTISGSLTLAEIGANNDFGTIIDNVQVSDVAVPEPGTAGLIVPAMIGLGIGLLKHKRDRIRGHAVEHQL